MCGYSEFPSSGISIAYYRFKRQIVPFSTKFWQEASHPALYKALGLMLAQPNWGFMVRLEWPCNELIYGKEGGNAEWKGDGCFVERIVISE